jgi:hypothetical protein
MFQDDITGLRFGNFEVLVRPDGSVNELGRGGFGRTLLARHFVLDTEVALKLIDERHALDEAARARFLKEAREQARLSHPGIARITDCGQVDGQLYYAVELCPGGNIKEFVSKTGPLSVSDTFHVLVQAAEALEYSHRRGVVHLDIKPSNLMLVFDEDGRPQVKLIDFGLVQRTAAETAPPGSGGRPLFSSGFASPEQIRSHPTDGRSDIFSLGMTGWFLLTGRNPVEGAADVVIQERLTGGDYEPHLPRQLTGKARAVLARMVKRNPNERYANGVDLLNELRACLQGMPPLSQEWQKRQRSGGALADRFMLEKGVQSRLGTIHQGIDRANRQRVKVTLLRSSNQSQSIAQYRKVAEAMRDLESSGLLKVLEVSEFSEGWAVVEESSTGTSLVEILRSEGAKPLGRYAPLVWQIGSAMDTAFSAGLTSVLLDEALVEQAASDPRQPIDWSAVSVKIPLSPGTSEQAATVDVDATADFTRTMTGSVAGVQLLARWLYFIVGGKNPPPSSLYSIKEYIAVPGLGDAANQILARHLCGQASPPKCEDLLRPLFLADGISWDSVGERIRQIRWGSVIQQAGTLVEEIENASADAEKVAESCRPFGEIVPDQVKECYACVSRVYEASSSAREKQSQLSQGGGRSQQAGRAAMAALEELSREATLSLAKAEAVLKNAKAAAEKIQQEKQQRERRRRELTESLADGWQRTETAAREAREMAEECRRVAPSASAARQMESLATQTAALASQLEALHREAGAAPEDQWGRLENQVPQARQVAADADEMARTCRSLLEKAKLEARRREEEAKLRAAAEAEIAGFIQQAEQIVAEVPGIAAEINSLATGCPSLSESSQRASVDSARAAVIVQDLHALRTLNLADAGSVNQARQKAATALDDLHSLTAGLKASLKHARTSAEEYRRAMEAFNAATVEIAALTEAAKSTVASLPDPSALHAKPGSSSAAWLKRCEASAAGARQSREALVSLAASLDPLRPAGAGHIIEEARRQAGLCRNHGTETLRHWQEADFAIKEAVRLEREAEEAARAKALAEAAAEAERKAREEERRRREEEEARRLMEEEAERRRLAEIERLRQEAEAKRLAEEAERRRIQEEEAKRIAEEEAGRLAEEEARRQAEEAGQRRIAAEIARRKEEEEARLRAEADVKRLAEEAERRRIEEEEARRRTEEETRQRAIEEARRQAGEAERRRIEEEAARVRTAAEAKRLAEEADKRRIQEEADHLAREEAEGVRAAEEARRLAEEAERRRIQEEENRRKAEAEAKRLAEEAEKRRVQEEAAHLAREEAERVRAGEEAHCLAEEERRRIQEEAARLQAAEEARLRAEQEAHRKRDEEARRKAEAEERHRLAEEAVRKKVEEEARRQAEAEEKRRLKEEAARLKAEAEAQKKAEPEAKRLHASQATPTLNLQPKGATPKKRSKAPMLAAAAAIALTGGTVAVWMSRNPGNKPDPPKPPVEVWHTTTLKTSGDAVTQRMVAAGDIQLSGIDDSSVTRDGDEIRIKIKEGTPPATVTLTSARKGLLLNPDRFDLRSDAGVPLSVSVTRAAGTVSLTDAAPSNASFYSRAYLKWAGDNSYVPPGNETGGFLDIKSPNTLTLPSGPWSVSYDDDEPAPGKPGQSGVITDPKDGGTFTVETGAQHPGLQLPQGWPSLLYGLLDWNYPVSAEEAIELSVLNSVEKLKIPGVDEMAKKVLAEMDAAQTKPVLAYPLYISKRDGGIYLLRPQPFRYRDVAVYSNIQLMGAITASRNAAQIKLDYNAVNPLSDAAKSGNRIPLDSLSACLAYTRDVLKMSGGEAALKDAAKLDLSVQILKIVQNGDWPAGSHAAEEFAQIWENPGEPCTSVHVRSDGSVTMKFKMTPESVRELKIKPAQGDQFTLEMKEGAGAYGKDSFAGTLSPQPALPAPLQKKR